jgi:hypothetical protein
MAQPLGVIAPTDPVDGAPLRPVLQTAKKKVCKKQKCSKWKGGKCRCGRD